MSGAGSTSNCLVLRGLRHHLQNGKVRVNCPLLSILVVLQEIAIAIIDSWAPSVMMFVELLVVVLGLHGVRLSLQH